MNNPSKGILSCDFLHCSIHNIEVIETGFLEDKRVATDEGLELAEGLFDRVEFWRIWGEEDVVDAAGEEKCFDLD